MKNKILNRVDNLKAITNILMQFFNFCSFYLIFIQTVS